MKFLETSLAGTYIIEIDKREDERGFFARSWCVEEFAFGRLDTKMVQCNVSFNKKKGTLRGLHYQLPPHAETKLVRCTRGALYDVIVDLRAGSPTFLQWFGVELTADNYRMLYIPQRFAHGFQTLEHQTEVFYQMWDFYAPDAARGFRWDDSRLGIVWPDSDRIISPRIKIMCLSNKHLPGSDHLGHRVWI
ncbi:MAG: dTDP-4-dehydrorhamnose 3,5-epimerase [Nitrospira sp.]|nr:dTDP-4-dehydrorhamnose 3,5-epimerase [Nitrospira sp.]MBX3338069.1 dTDP-4-dehydrorhamnose 3,5-epimerase [Nitrospira sp.]MCW5780423.1 dTDP-4-dehydrorhamnose 3,5-epimerase [Nitrospira sp.]